MEDLSSMKKPKKIGKARNENSSCLSHHTDQTLPPASCCAMVFGQLGIYGRSVEMDSSFSASFLVHLPLTQPAKLDATSRGTHPTSAVRGDGLRDETNTNKKSKACDIKKRTLQTTYNLFIVSFLILSLVENDRSNLRFCFIGFFVQKVLKIKVFLSIFLYDMLCYYYMTLKARSGKVAIAR